MEEARRFADWCRRQRGWDFRPRGATLMLLLAAAVKDPGFLAKLRKAADSCDLKYDFKSGKIAGRSLERVRELFIEGVLGEESVSALAKKLTQRAIETVDENDKQLCLAVLRAIGRPFEPPKRGKPSRS